MRRRIRAGLIASIVLPALAAALGVALVARPGDAREAPVAGAAAPVLAGLAERGDRSLQPLLAAAGSGGVSLSPLEPLTGGIRPAPPARISMPAAGVDAAVDAVRASAGSIEVPDVGRAGWFDAGPRPGEPGRAIVIGHLDTETGPGLFARVPRVPPGTLVSITDRRGEVHRYNVIGGAQVPKDKFPAEHVYGSADAPVLVLITCGGPYEPGEGYRDNVLVYARAA